MTRTHTRRCLPLLLLALAACRTGPETPAPRSDLVGVWELVTVDGAALPAPSPEEPNVLLHSVVMTLEGGGAYTLASTFRMNGESEANDATIDGTWVATGDALTFHGTQGPAVVDFGYSRNGDLILLVDEQGHEWAMRRR